MRIYIWLSALFLIISCRVDNERQATKVIADLPESSIASSYKIEGDKFIFENHWNEYHAYGNKEYIISISKSGHVDRSNGKKEGVYDIQISQVEGAELWNSSIAADNINLERDLIMAFTDGGAEYEDYFSYYNIDNGQKLIDFTNSGMIVSIPNSGDKRFLGFTSRNSASVKWEDDAMLGQLTYASNKEKIQTISIYARNEKTAQMITDYTPDMNFRTDSSSTNKIMEAGKTLILWNTSADYTAEDVSDFSVRLSFFTKDNERLDILAPIISDQIDVNGIVFDNKIFKIKAN